MNNKEIKFKFFDKGDKIMRYADIEYFDDMIGFRAEHFSIDADGEPDMIEIIQYTGLKDKNGKEGYFSDWVRLFDGEEGELIKDWCFGSIGIQNLKHFRSMENIYLAYLKANKLYYANLCETWEIIGNVNENPELKNK